MERFDFLLGMIFGLCLFYIAAGWKLRNQRIFNDAFFYAALFIAVVIAVIQFL